MLTVLQAYKAMVKFLENYYEETNSDDVGSLLGSMDLLADERTFDPAMWQEWLEAIEKAKADKGW